MFFCHVGRICDRQKSGKHDLRLQYGYQGAEARYTMCRPRCASRNGGWSRRCSSEAAASANAPPRCLPDAAEEGIQELARAQHRWVVEAVREGFVDDVLNQETAEELVVQFLGSQRVSGEEVVLRFRVLSGGYVAASAQVGACWKIEAASGVLEGDSHR